MLFIPLAIIIIFTLFLSGKDADSYQLKDKTASGTLTSSRIKRWHRDGFALDAIFTSVLAYAFHDWWILLLSVLVRLSIFDISFNFWSSLNMNYLGSTAWVDKQFVKIFGINGAVKKSLFFLILTLALISYLTWGIKLTK